MVNQRIVGKVLLRQINNLDIVQFFLDRDDLFGKIRRAIVQDMQDFHDGSFLQDYNPVCFAMHEGIIELTSLYDLRQKPVCVNLSFLCTLETVAHLHSR